MELSRVDLYFVMIFLIMCTEAGLNPEKDNVCLKTIIYNERVRADPRGPTSKRDKVICSQENCAQDTTTGMREGRVITRTKILPSCCEGYKEDTEGNQCIPVCPNGCGNGKCVAPGKCSCDAGFYGSECEKTCEEDRWGKDCTFECNCSESEVCNKIFGCLCRPGWIGERCATPCPVGYYGFLCQEKCFCSANFCDHVTGMCIESKEDNLPNGEEKETNENPKTKSFNVSTATNYTVFEFTKVEDRSPEKNADATQGEVFNKNLTAVAGEEDEPAENNPPYFKDDEGEKKKGSSQGMRSTLVHEINFSAIHDSGDPVRFSPASTTSDPPENPQEIDILKLITTNLTAVKENAVQRNEPFPRTSDTQTTPVGSAQNSRVSSFIPTFSVLTASTFLIILIIGKWLVITFRKKIEKMADVELGPSDEELSILSTDKFACENNLGHPVFVADILNTAPILQTFKPLLPNSEKMPTEKKVSHVAECFM